MCGGEMHWWSWPAKVFPPVCFPLFENTYVFFIYLQFFIGQTCFNLLSSSKHSQLSSGTFSNRKCWISLLPRRTIRGGLIRRVVFKARLWDWVLFSAWESEAEGGGFPSALEAGRRGGQKESLTHLTFFLREHVCRAKLEGAKIPFPHDHLTPPCSGTRFCSLFATRKDLKKRRCCPMLCWHRDHQSHPVITSLLALPKIPTRLLTW